MCGWCCEYFVKDALEKERSGRIRPEDCDDDWTAWFYLREANDFPLALERLTRSKNRKKVVPLEYLSADVVLLRMLEVLVRHGFSSPQYQRLIRRKLIRSLIVKACAGSLKPAFLETVEVPGIGPLAILYEAGTYLHGKEAELLQRPASVLPACLDLLRYYRRGWLRNEAPEGEVLCQNEQSPSGFGPIEEITDARRDQLELMLRALFFGISVIGRLPSGTHMLHTLAKEPPAYVPGFYGNDLWLQRMAALNLCDLIGFDGFCRHFNDFRDTLFYFVDLKRRLTDEQKLRLLKMARRRAAGKRKDDFFSIEEWLKF